MTNAEMLDDARQRLAVERLETGEYSSVPVDAALLDALRHLVASDADLRNRRAWLVAARMRARADLEAMQRAKAARQRAFWAAIAQRRTVTPIRRPA